MHPGDPDDPSAGSEARWELWRQDDNGNRVLIQRFASRSEAEERLREFEARGHTQTYWIEEAR